MDALKALLEPYRRVCVAGMCKNAGKTTALCRALACWAGEAAGVSSIGLDGEKTDLVTGAPKPSIPVKRGTLFATAERLLPRCRLPKTILDVTSLHTPLGRVVLARAEEDGAVELAGPSITQQMCQTASALEALGARRILIDGALFRRSLAAPRLCGGVLLATGAAYHPDMARTVADTAYTARLMTLPVIEPGTLAEREDALLLEGALTDARAEALIKAQARRIVAADPTKLLLSRQWYGRLLAAGKELLVLDRPRLIAVTANPSSPTGAGYDSQAFIEALIKAIPAPVLNVLER